MTSVQLFGIGLRSTSPAITAQSRINCRIEPRREHDRTTFALVGREGLAPFVTSLGGNATRGMHAVDTLATPLMFVVQGGAVYSINNAGGVASIGAIPPSSADVSMADDGKFLVIVDGAFGYVYNMQTPAGLVKITDGNFTTTPRTVTWQDRFFIVTSSGSTRQFQLSQISATVDPTVWPAIQIDFAGSGSGALQNGVGDHSILALFGDTYTEFWQDAGTPDMPYARLPGSAQQFGLAAPWSVSKFDNSLAGLFKDATGALNVSRLSGFQLQKISDQDLEQILQSYSTVADAQGYGFTVAGHPMYVLSLPTAGATWVYDALSQAWCEYQDTNGAAFWGTKFASFLGHLYVSDRRNGNIYRMRDTVYDDNGSALPLEVTSKHIYNDGKYIGISQVEIEMESGVGTVSGQGVNPVIDLLVSKDGGNTWFSVGYSSIGKIGEYTERVVWNSLGATRDWVLRLRITDPVKRVITGARCEMVGGPF